MGLGLYPIGPASRPKKEPKDNDIKSLLDLGSSCPKKGLGATPYNEWQAGHDHNLWRRLPFIRGVLVAQLCPTLCNPIDYSQPGSSVHGIFQAKILEWVTISFSRYLPDPGIKPGSPALQADSLLSEPPGKPLFIRGMDVKLAHQLPGQLASRAGYKHVGSYLLSPIIRGLDNCVSEVGTGQAGDLQRVRE